jgi:predicted acetyltransferase
MNIRSCHETEVEKWIQFLNEQLEYTQEEGSYGIDFAPFFEKDALKNSVLIFENNKIIASGAIYYREVLTLANQKIKVALIGAIATDKQKRGQGFATKVLESLIKKAEENQVTAIILWSENFDFYKKFGFHPFSSQMIYDATEYVLKQNHLNQKFIIENDWSLNDVTRLYENHRLKTVRTLNDWNKILKIKSVLKLQAKNSQNEVIAYLGVNRGKDMKNVVHEWGYKNDAEGREALWSLLYFVSLKQKPVLWLTNPHLEDPIRNILIHLQEPIYDGPQGLLKVCDLNFDPNKKENEIWFWGLDSM